MVFSPSLREASRKAIIDSMARDERNIQRQKQASDRLKTSNKYTKTKNKSINVKKQQYIKKIKKSKTKLGYAALKLARKIGVSGRIVPKCHIKPAKKGRKQREY